MSRFASVLIVLLSFSGQVASAQKMYWSINDWNGGDPRILRSNLDGTEVETIIPISELVSPDAIAVDIRGGKIYWTDTGHPNQPETKSIKRANLDGTNIEVLVDTGLTEPVGLALDLVARKMYWVDRGSAALYKADLDGSNREEVMDGMQSVNYLALALPTQPIPAVGNIGMVVMVALLLGAGAVVLARRERTAKHRDVA